MTRQVPSRVAFFLAMLFVLGLLVSVLMLINLQWGDKLSAPDGGKRSLSSAAPAHFSRGWS